MAVGGELMAKEGFMAKDASPPVIELEHVYVAYHERLILEDVSLRV
jgi:ABC-type molybdenum transport system ATPase subunit/photorepair protein PhrA